MREEDFVQYCETAPDGWQRILRGKVIYVEDGADPLVVISPTYLRVQHRDWPDRGRDLPVPREEGSFTPRLEAVPARSCTVIV